MANFMTDQFEQDLKRNATVEDGEMTQEEADDQASEWEEVSLLCIYNIHWVQYMLLCKKVKYR